LAGRPCLKENGHPEDAGGAARFRDRPEQ